MISQIPSNNWRSDVGMSILKDGKITSEKNMRPLIYNNLLFLYILISQLLCKRNAGENFFRYWAWKKDKLDKNSAELATFNQKSLFVVDWKNDGDRVQHLDFSLISMTK